MTKPLLVDREHTDRNDVNKQKHTNKKRTKIQTSPLSGRISKPQIPIPY